MDNMRQERIILWSEREPTKMLMDYISQQADRYNFAQIIIVTMNEDVDAVPSLHQLNPYPTPRFRQITNISNIRRTSFFGCGLSFQGKTAILKESVVSNNSNRLIPERHRNSFLLCKEIIKLKWRKQWNRLALIFRHLHHDIIAPIQLLIRKIFAFATGNVFPHLWVNWCCHSRSICLCNNWDTIRLTDSIWPTDRRRVDRHLESIDSVGRATIFLGGSSTFPRRKRSDTFAVVYRLLNRLERERRETALWKVKNEFSALGSRCAWNARACAIACQRLTSVFPQLFPLHNILWAWA